MHRTDPRVIKTKNNIKTAYIQLIKTNNIKNISVSNITDLAQINRSTFYDHYLDIYDLTDDIEDDLIDIFYQKAFSHIDSPSHINASSNWITDLFNVLEENHELLSALFNNHTNSNFTNKLTDCIKIWIMRSQNDLSFNKFPKIEQYLIAYFSYGIVGTIQTWLNDPQRLSSQEITQIIMSIIEKNSHNFPNEKCLLKK